MIEGVEMKLSSRSAFSGTRPRFLHKPLSGGGLLDRLGVLVGNGSVTDNDSHYMKSYGCLLQTVSSRMRLSSLQSLFSTYSRSHECTQYGISRPADPQLLTAPAEVPTFAANSFLLRPAFLSRSANSVLSIGLCLYRQMFRIIAYFSANVYKTLDIFIK